LRKRIILGKTEASHQAIKHDQSKSNLTDEQLAEVERRLDDPNPVFRSLEEVRARFARRNG
jgi:hypothetical protein